MLSRLCWWIAEKLITVVVFYVLLVAAGAVIKICGGTDTWMEILIGAGIGAVLVPVACSIEYHALPVVIVEDRRKKK